MPGRRRIILRGPNEPFILPPEEDDSSSSVSTTPEQDADRDERLLETFRRLAEEYICNGYRRSDAEILADLKKAFSDEQ